MKSVGIEIGTYKSSMAVVEIGNINIIKNSLGEEIEPSVISIINDRIFAGENVYLNKKSKFDNTISEIKRLISYNFIYDNKFFEDYKKFLSYKIERANDNSLLINIDGKTFTIEEILSFLIKQIILNGKNNNIFANKFVFTIPSCFGIKERELIKKAAKLAKIEESNLQMINETSASALAYGIQKYNKETINKDEFSNNYEYSISVHDFENLTYGNENSGPALNSQNNIFVFDLGAGCLNLSVISIIETNEKKLNFKVKANLGNPFFGGIDFDNRLVQYCVDEFCELNKINKEDIYNNKNAIRRLKFRCEIAKKILDKNESVIIYIKNFIQNIDFCIKITRDIFDLICSDFYIEIGNKILRILKIANIGKENIIDVLLIGGNAKIPKIVEILNNIFGQEKIRNHIDSNKIVITGAALYANEMNKNNKNKKKFFLNEIITSSYGINILNDDINSFLKHGDKMLKFIQKNSSFPYTSKFRFKCKVSNNNKIFFNVYEGESNFVKFNKKLESIVLTNFNENLENSEIQLDITFILDSNYILKIESVIPEINFKKELTIGKYDKKRLNKKSMDLETCELDSELVKNKENLKEYSSNYRKYKDDERNKVLINCCKCCQDILEIYDKLYSSENKIIKLYQLNEDLFSYYFERLKIKNKSVNDNSKIIIKIKEKMKNLIDIEGFNEILNNKFKELSNLNRNIYYSIILNYIELIISENVNILKNNKDSKLHSFKIHFKKSEEVLEKYSNEMKIYEIDEELSKKIEILQKINNCIKSLISNPKNLIDVYKNLEALKKEINNLIQGNRKYNCLKDILEIINDLINLKNHN